MLYLLKVLLSYLLFEFFNEEEKIGSIHHLKNSNVHTKNYSLSGYILGVFTHTTAWEQAGDCNFRLITCRYINFALLSTLPCLEFRAGRVTKC